MKKRMKLACDNLVFYVFFSLSDCGECGTELGSVGQVIVKDIFYNKDIPTSNRVVGRANRC
jgi:hypothetical protein